MMNAFGSDLGFAFLMDQESKTKPVNISSTALVQKGFRG